jgi:hypothetical protein
MGDQKLLINFNLKTIFNFNLRSTLSRWSRLHLQSSVPTPVSRKVDLRQAAGRKNNSQIFIRTWWKHVVPTPLSGIRVGKRKNQICYFIPTLSSAFWWRELKIRFLMGHAKKMKPIVTCLNVTLYGNVGGVASMEESPKGPYNIDIDIGKKHCPCSCLCTDFLFFLGFLTFLPDSFLASSHLSCLESDVKSSHLSSLHLWQSFFSSSSGFLSSSIFGASTGTGMKDWRFFLARPEI